MFAWGAGIFFIGCFIFKVPSNLALEKFGASRAGSRWRAS
jgi:ACS family tartrate transporter-like MFS transporter